MAEPDDTTVTAALVEKASTFIGADASDAEYVADCLTQAAKLVGAHVRKAEVPDSILERAYLEVAADLYHRRTARNGVVGFDAGADVQPFRIARDVMLSAYPLLRPYVGPGIG